MFKVASRVFAAMLLLAVGVTFAQTTTSVPTVNKTVGQTSTLSWGAVTTYTDGTVIPSTAAVTYDVYEAAPVSGTVCNSVATGAPIASAITATSWVTPVYTTAGVYCYVMTATVNSMQSSPSNVVQATVANQTPNPPGTASIK